MKIKALKQVAVVLKTKLLLVGGSTGDVPLLWRSWTDYQMGSSACLDISESWHCTEGESRGECALWHYAGFLCLDTTEDFCEGTTSDTSLACSPPQPASVILGINMSVSNLNKKVLPFYKYLGRQDGEEQWCEASCVSLRAIERWHTSLVLPQRLLGL